MSRTYFCPKCKSVLNPHTKIIMAAKNGDQRGLILFEPVPGDYNIIHSPEMTFEKGDLVELSCPVCSVSLTSKVEDHLSVIGFKFENGTKGKVFFSRAVGEEATFFSSKEHMESYGHEAHVYSNCNFFGSSIDDDYK